MAGKRRRISLPATIFTTTLVVLAALPGLAAGQAAPTTAGLTQLSDWYIEQVGWGALGGLPADNEFAAPLVCQYNYAYGMTVVGLNVRSTSSQEYYAAVALYENGLLTVMNAIGPLAAPAQWDASPFHLAAGLSDGRLVCFLTAAGEFPKQQVLANDYAPGTGFDTVVYTPQPANTEWRDWWIVAAYQNASNAPGLDVENYDGNGRLLSSFPAIATDGQLAAVSYLDFPVNESPVATLLFTLIEDDAQVLGNNSYSRLYSAYFDPGQGWYIGLLRDAGLYSGQTYVEYRNGEVIGMCAYDESDTRSVTSRVHSVSLRPGSGQSLLSSLGTADYMPVLLKRGLFSMFPSARTKFPMLALSDELDIYLSYYNPDRSIRTELGFRDLRLNSGLRREGQQRDYPQYAVTGVAGTAHWSTGNPEIFWVQQGSPERAGGQLFRLNFAPRR